MSLLVQRALTFSAGQSGNSCWKHAQNHRQQSYSAFCSRQNTSREYSLSERNPFLVVASWAHLFRLPPQASPVAGSVFALATKRHHIGNKLSITERSSPPFVCSTGSQIVQLIITRLIIKMHWSSSPFPAAGRKPHPPQCCHYCGPIQ